MKLLPVVGTVAGLMFLPTMDLPAQCQYTGMITRPSGIGFCHQATHLMEDICSPTPSAHLIRSDTLDLDQSSCTTIVVQGPSANDLECPGCEVINVQTINPTTPTCIIQVKDLNVTGAAITTFSWPSLVCSNRYDLIRGNVSSLSRAGPNVDLGAVSCVANDLPTLSTQDGATPAPGQAFFYLVRAQGPIGTTPYGSSSAGASELPTTGDCPL